MGSFIALISICLNIAAFYWILILSQRVKAMEEAGASFDIEDLQNQLEAHIKALREENNRFIQKVEARVKEVDKTSSPTIPMAQASPEQVSKVPERMESMPALQQETPQEETSEPSWELKIDTEEPIDTMETSMMSRILQLKEAGLTSEDIAKKLGLGKGEVALMLKLHEKR